MCITEMGEGQVRSNCMYFYVDQVTLHLCQFCHWQKEDFPLSKTINPEN